MIIAMTILISICVFVGLFGLIVYLAYSILDLILSTLSPYAYRKENNKYKKDCIALGYIDNGDDNAISRL